ncbi:MAG TPA: ATP-dependent RecD-like DNA helicase [Clostridiaceae bacterium]|nr:ATP-dependent RecD-like DNA helicase [Clostridiaceae bacterium]
MEIKGEVQDIIYKNEINSYTIATFKTSEEETTVVGYLPFINSGDTLKVNGVFIEHQEYGRQFKIETFEKIMPQTLDALERYLANGTIKGIGPATAKKIVGTFGEETINIFKFEPKMLSNIKGITEEKAISIAEEFIANWEIWQLVGFLDKFGVGPQSAEKIYKTLGTNAIEEIEANPYILVDLVNKVDFTQIDKMALGIGIEYNNDKRIKSGIKHALRLSTYNGHSTVAYENLVQFVSTLLGVNGEYVEENIINLKAKNEIIIEERENGKKLEEWVYLEEFYNAEKNIANKLISLKEGRNIKKINGFDRKIKTLEKHSDIELSEKQLEAVRAINDNNVCVITGGPGTGKTTIIKTILELYKQEGKKVVLCAPTGRAAKRMSETTGEDAKTLHRLLELGKIVSDDSQDINTDLAITPIDADIIIVDEVSMVDLFLMNYLVKGIYQGSKLVLVGDVDQLPSVGPGNVLKDIINSEAIVTIVLNKIFRQAAKSKIILNSHKVNEGKSFIGTEYEKDILEDFFYISENSKTKILDNVISLSTGRLKKYGNYDFLKSIQVITPTKKGELGTKELNKLLQEKINPYQEEKKEKKYGDIIFRENDRIMQIKNNYDIYWEKNNDEVEYGSGVFNGEFGTIIKINESEKQIKIKFDDEKVAWYQYTDLDQIEHAYAITVHKAQRK